MKLSILALFMVLLVGGAAPVSAKSTETLRVQVNREKRAPRSGISVRFVSLVEDSRCPVDVQCIHAGSAHIRVRVTRNGRSQYLELKTNDASTDARFAGYEFKLSDLAPVPRSNVRINRNGYVATINITRVPR